MNELVKSKYEEIEQYLKSSTEHQNKKIDTLLYHPESKSTYVICSDGLDSAIEFSPYTKEYQGGYTIVPEWDYNYDYYIFDLLEKDCEIGYISNEIHYSIWNSISELYPNDIEFKDGVNKYIDYCKKNNITREYLEEKVGFDTPEIMDKFNNKIKILYVEPKKIPVEMEIDNTLEEKQRLVGDGYIECVYLPNDKDVVLICNEEGKINGMPFNRDIGYDIIAGPFLIVGDDYENGDFKSLTEEQILKYKIRFDKNSIRQTENKITAIKFGKVNIERDER